MAEESGDHVEMEEESEDENGEVEEAGPRRMVYLPGQPLEKGEALVCDESAYVMYHRLHAGAPCLSFDVLRDHLGNGRNDYPLTMYLAAGTQAERTHTNSVIVMKMSNLTKIEQKPEKDSEDDESSSEDESDEEESPELVAATMNHKGCVNRIRTTTLNGRPIAATWSELRRVFVWDLSDAVTAVDDSHAMTEFQRAQENTAPVFTFSGHVTEGFALDWSQVSPGCLLTGDCSKNVHLWKPQDGGTWIIDQRPFVGHTHSVEDLQWSPTEASVFASCSADKSIRIWDTRAPHTKACMLTVQEAHQSDVNVISWNSYEPFIVSGGDDGLIKIWDLREFQAGKACALFKHHLSPITSVEWHPTDSTVYAASGADDQLTLWDLAVEKDPDAGHMNDDPSLKDVPPQLLFIHQGQQDIKELHWHPQIPGVVMSTAHSGFDIFRTISV